MRFEDIFGHTIKESLLQDGVNDPHIFKAVFIIGGPGSGKSTVANRLFFASVNGHMTTSTGMRYINPDEFFELMAAKNNWDMPAALNEPSMPKLKLGWDKSIKKRTNAIDRRLGMVIDGTGRKTARIRDIYNNLKSLGYDIMGIVIQADIETAKARNNARDRQVADHRVEKYHHMVNDSIGEYSNLFGENFVVFDNNEVNSPEEKAAWDSRIDVLWKKVNQFINSPVKSEIAQQWIRDERQPQQAAESIELKEYSVNLSTYGEWIDTTNRKTYTVEPEQHYPWIKQHLDLLPGKSKNAYVDAFDAGWVRVSHSNFRTERSLELWGSVEAIKLARKWVISALEQAQFVRLEVIKPGKDRPARSLDFTLPQQKDKLIAWFGVQSLNEFQYSDLEAVKGRVNDEETARELFGHGNESDKILLQFLNGNAEPTEVNLLKAASARYLLSRKANQETK